MPETNTQISYISSLQLAGLTPEQAEIYQVLLKNGPLPAGKIHQKTPYKRGLVYKLLDSMVESGVVIKRTDLAKIAIFEPAHPLRLKELAETKEKEAKQAQSALTGIIDQMTSEFNLVSGKPGVQFFEGLEGVKKVLANSLSSRSEIYTYADIEAIVKYIDKINQEYVERRERLKIKKKALILDTPFARKYLDDYHRDITDIKLIQYRANPFQTVMQIYDNKVSYITLNPDNMIGVIIEDPHIYSTHKYLFEYMWNTAVLYENLKSNPTTPQLSIPEQPQ